MSDKIKGLVVTLDMDVSDEYADHIIEAISMIKHVVSVDKSVVNIDDHMNRMRIKSQIRSDFYEFAKDKLQ